ncbi:MAG: hypothetical protein GXO24_04485 [Chlorobi bacterium]|nr:hypothetical protein [Chlorobiota bacterium]
MTILVSGLFSAAESYGKTTATVEIIIMLLVAFILGYMLRYFLEKSKDQTDWKAKFESLQHEHEMLDKRFSLIRDENRQLTTELDECRKKALSARNTGYGFAGTAAKTAAPARKDDLKVVEGIGPKIEQLLYAEAIYTWEDLADTPVERLRQILDKAGPRYRVHDPESWPFQARMAAGGRWDELEKWQEEHKYGKF